MMVTKPQPPRIPLPKGWQGCVKSAAIYVFSLAHPFVFTDRHAYLKAAEFFRDMGDLGNIDWDILQGRDFKHDPDDPGKFERYQAEALVHEHLPVAALSGIACSSDAIKNTLNQLVVDFGLELKVRSLPGWYF